MPEKSEISKKIYSAMEWIPVVGTLILRDKIKKLEGYLYEAVFDEVTGLYNRKKVMEISKTESLRVARYDYPLSLAMLDIDNFKPINDTYGHLAGDRVLKEIATLLKSSLRIVDVPGRYGGDEFIILLPHTDYKGARVAGEKISYDIASHRFKDYDENVTVSIGITDVETAFQSGKNEMISKISKPGNSNLEEKLNAFVNSLINKADNALLQAKNLGKNRVCVYGVA